MDDSDPHAGRAEDEDLSDEGLARRSEWRRLEDQLAWYGRRSRECRRWHKGLRLAQVILAATIPVISLAELAFSPLLTAALGALIAVLEAVEQLNQFGPLWIQYRATAESLKHEKYLLLAGAGPYRGLTRPEALRLLAERVEERVSREHARWVRTSEQAVAASPAAAAQPPQRGE